ncbi:very short patch repair endonuclease [bacterium]|nr:very short patch repair endonuclease [bacterium]
MTDTFAPEKRHEIMASVRNANTQPERVVRSIVHRMGYRFRLHVRGLPGCPDIVLPRHRKIIFVHGCFWHQHEGCSRSKLPSTNTTFWRQKLERNALRDAVVQRELAELGWSVLVVWACELRDLEHVRNRISSFLAPPEER